MNKFRTICALIFLVAGLAQAQPAQKMSAREIMDRAAAVYSSCQTYSDEGEVTIDSGFASSSFHHLQVQPFFTAFVRSSSFRFEFRMLRRRDEWDRFIAWKNGDTEKSWWSLTQHDETVPKALRSFAKLSGGSAQTIPTLLDPTLFPGSNVFGALEDARLAGEEKVDGRAAFKLEGTRKGQPAKLWIDSHEFLILKRFQQENSEQFRWQTTVKYKPLVNAQVASEKLAFNPPAISSAVRFLTVRGKRNEKSETGDLTNNLPLNPKKTKPDETNPQPKVVTPEDIDVVRVETTLVALDVLAVDKQGRSVKGLAQSDFAVIEDGHPQQVSTFALGDDLSRPRSIVLIIDYSGSQLPFIRTSVEAAKTLVDKLNPRDRMAIVTDDVKVLTGFTDDRNKLKNTLDSLWREVSKGNRLGRSKQYSALVMTLEMLARETAERPIIIFQTDGDELIALRPTAAYATPFPMAPWAVGELVSFSIADVFATALKSEVTIYSVVPGVRLVGVPETELTARARRMEEISSAAVEQLRPEWGNEMAKVTKTLSEEGWIELAHSVIWTQGALATLAEISGGWADFLERPEEAEGIYGRILSDINGRYIIGYQPTNLERDGKLRRVKIEVRGHPEYRVLGRTSYYAPDQRK